MCPALSHSFTSEGVIAELEEGAYDTQADVVALVGSLPRLEVVDDMQTSLMCISPIASCPENVLATLCIWHSHPIPQVRLPPDLELQSFCERQQIRAHTHNQHTPWVVRSRVGNAHGTT